MALEVYEGEFDLKQAAHLLRRATFTNSKDDIDALAALTVDQAVELLFNNDQPVIDPVPPIDPEIGDTWIGIIDDGDENARQGYFKNWLLGQMLNPVFVPDDQKLSYSTREKITFFLHTYFTGKVSKINNSRALYYQSQLLRLFAFDESVSNDLSREFPLDADFKMLTKKVCIDNGMLIFLDGRDNVKGNVNENFGRELLELYSIGRGLEGTNPPLNELDGFTDYFTFTEKDVRAAAEVLSGWTIDHDFAVIDEDTGLPRGVVRGNPNDANQHAEGDKIFSRRLGENNEVATISPDPLLLENGRPTEASALDEIDQLIELLFTKEETSRHLCRKLYRYFVYYEIDEAIENSIIQEMTDLFIDENYKLQPLLKALFKSQHFYDAATIDDVRDDKFGGIIKSPVDLVVGTVNFLNIEIPDYQTQTEEFYDFTNGLLDSANSMGMDFYEPFEVAGYSAYHQFPRYNRNWISTHWLTQRYRFIRELLNSPAMDNPDRPLINPRIFVVDNFNNVGADARQLIIELAPYLLPMAENLTYDEVGDPGNVRGLTPARMRYFLQAFLGFTTYETESDMAVAGWIDLYTQEPNYLEASTRLQSLFNAMMQSPEYQLF
ncbi:MAG: DUF1800 family protein [Bacteroidota bacterium]